MPFLDLDSGIQIHYRDGGTGKPLLFMPGIAATLDSWNYQVLSLQDSYRCITVDMRGHGDSDKPYSGYSYSEMCNDIHSVLLALDLCDVTLVGWSMGAGVGLNYVVDFNADSRVSKLAMVAPATPRLLATDTETFGLDADAAEATLEGMRVALPETMAAFSGANFHREDMQATTAWFLSMWLKMPAYVGYQCFKTLLTEDLRDKLKLVDVPTLICHGRHDVVAPPGWSDYMATRIPQCKLTWFENSGHALMVEEPDRLSEQISRFVG